ncbi:vesicular inhibitory amino acid transporter-like [Thalassophryne amazonica]|uniref:vesicular inhibitory amino acid transporter-like n=1 Tax=Thalassophryne amazonica TaxID=390379 RepID=UPI001471C134|nr:vesicular inhibitory amino acid transporter-like [Thalassophryne amazonica]
MGSFRFGSQQSCSAAGSLWNWTTSRLRLDSTTRFFQQNEELLVLTKSDELSQSYGEDTRTPLNGITSTKNPGLDDTRPNRASLKETGLLVTGQNDLTTSTEGDRPTTNGSTSVSWQESPAFKETRTTVISAGLRTVTVTSAVSAADSPWSKNIRTYSKGRSRGSAVPADKMGSTMVDSEENLSDRQHLYQDIADSDMNKSEKIVEQNPQFYASKEASPTGLSPSPTITAWEAGWNVTNAIQGIFVLGLPFALVQSGYVGLLLLIVSAWMCNRTGRILVACLYEVEQSGCSGSVSQVRVRRSYQDIVKACCGGLWPCCAVLGGWIVNVAQITELLMTCTLYLVFSTSLLYVSFSQVAIPESVCCLVSLMFVSPCLLLTDLRPVSTLSLLCSLAHILISLLIVLYCLSEASSWSWSSLPLSVDPEDFVISVGVIIFSYTSQIFLPPLEGSMEDRGQFNAMLGWAHAAACIMKTMFSLLAVLTWGAQTSEVITDNLPSALRPLVNMFLLAKALLSYPLPFYSAAEILHNCLLGDDAVSLERKHEVHHVSRAALLVRGVLLVTSFLLALLVPSFSLLMGLTGSVTGSAMTLILPCVFHLRLQRARLTVADRLIDVGILSLGCICCVSGVICSIKRLLKGL